MGEVGDEGEESGVEGQSADVVDPMVSEGMGGVGRDGLYSQQVTHVNCRLHGTAGSFTSHSLHALAMCLLSVN
jgi:hypothetical protein